MRVLEEALDRLIEFSPALRRYSRSGIDLDQVLSNAESLVEGKRVEPVGVESPGEKEELMRLLRECRRSALLTAAVAEQTTDDPETTFGFLTSCAEDWICTAFEAALESACRPHGFGVEVCTAECPWSVLGLGKLGALELNPSSDVDLMLMYASDDPLPGTVSVTAHDLFEMAGREAAHLLSQATADGFCLRVDFDLRPEGRSGALANSLDAVLNYYEQHGSPLDRMALTRARPVAGSRAFGTRIIGSLAPFVYPRSLVSGALSSLADVLGKLRGVRRRASEAFNLKTGRGGIRDVELFVAAQQLVHGGRLPELRGTRTLAILDSLNSLGIVEGKEAESLKTSYRFLRRLEHLLQYQEDRQTQDFPLTGQVTGSIAGLVGDGMDGESLVRSLELHRSATARPVDRLFGLGGGERTYGDATLDLFLSSSSPTGERESAARKLGFVDVEAALSHVSRLRGVPSSPLHPEHQERFPGFDRRILRSVSRSVWPDGALEFVARLARFAGNLRLFRLCRDDENILEALIDVGSSSQVVAAAMNQDSALALEQAMTGFEGGVPEAGGLGEEMEILLAEGSLDDAGERLAVFRRRHVVAIAISDLTGHASDEDVGKGLSLVADACIGGALKWNLGPAVEGLAVLGYGRLGGREMGYLSDLDLVFVHDGGPDRFLPAVQRALGLLTTRGLAGSMYTLDLRLRPSGTQGPLLVAVSELERFYGEEAGGPELLGSLNLRVVAGDLRFGERVITGVRRKSTEKLRDPDALFEVLRIRRLQHEGVEKTRLRAYDPKLEAGGLLDIETAVHLWGIQGIADVAGVPTGTLAILGLLTRREGPQKPDFAVLDRVYRFLMRLSNRAHLVLDRPIMQASADGPAADRLAKSLGFGEEGTPADGMWDAYKAALKDGTRVCERLISDLPGVRNR